MKLIFMVTVLFLTACQSTSARKPASESVVQVPVIPVGSNFTVAQDIFLAANTSSGHFMRSESFTSPNGLRNIQCRFQHVGNTGGPGKKIRLKKGNSYTISDITTLPEYNEAAGPSTFTKAHAVYSLKNSKSTAATPDDYISFYCGNCAENNYYYGMSSSGCEPANPEEITKLFQQKQMPIFISDGPAVRNFPKQAEIIDINYRSAPQSTSPAIEI